jgi:hypothetical protein
MNEKINFILDNHAKKIAQKYSNWLLNKYLDNPVNVTMGDDDAMFQEFLDYEKANAKPEKDSKPYFISKNSK